MRPIGERELRDAEHLRAWARGHHVYHLLGRAVRELNIRDRERLLPAAVRAYAYRTGLTVQAVMMEKPTYSDPLLAEVRVAVREALEEEALRVERGQQHEVEAALAHPRSPRGEAADVVLGPLAELRRRLRALVQPRHPADLDPGRRLRFSLGGRAPTVTLDLDEPYAYARIRVRIPVELHAPLTVTCSHHTGPCDHALIAVDDLLRLLTRDPPPPQLAALMGLAETPAWVRALDELEALSPTVTSPADVELSWWVRPSSGMGAGSVVPLVKKRSKRGDWLAPRTVRSQTLLSGSMALDEIDQRIAQRLVMLDRHGWLFEVAEVMELLVDHPRVVSGPRIDQLEPWRVEQREARVEVRRELELVRARLVVEGHALVAVNDRELLVDTEGHRLVVARVTRAVRTRFERVCDAITKLPPADVPAFAARLALLDPALGVEAVDLVPVDEVGARDAWTLRLASRDDGGLEATLLVRPIEDGPSYRAGEPPARAIAPAAGDRLVAALRDLDAERRAVSVRWVAWGVGESEACSRLFMDHDAVLTLIGAVRNDPSNTVVEWTTQPIRVLPRVRARQLRLGLASGPDWFAVEGDVAVEDHRATLAMLLDAARRKSAFVRVADDTWMHLESAVSERLRAMEPYIRHVKGRLEVGALSVPALAEAMGDVAAPKAWVDVVHRARAAADITPVLPTTLQAELRPYQVEGFVWMARLAAWGAGAVLADDMGLGKTVEAIAALLHRADEGPALVIAPTSVTHNWRRELARFAPSLEVRALRDAAGAVQLDALGPGQVVVTSYGLAVIEQAALAAQPFATLVIDEAQVIKNPSSQRSKAVRGLNARWRLALTGTPVENHLGDLWAIMAAVSPGLLGSWDAFRLRWVGVSGPALDGLRRVVRPFVLRRTKGDVLSELPPKTEVIIDVELSPEERRLYDDARLAATAELRGLGEELGTAQARFHVLAAITRLRQLACDASLVVSGAAPPSSKLARFADLTASLVDEGHAVLAFSQFVRLLDGAEAVLRARGVPFLRLDGSTPSEARGDIVDRFQGGGAAVLLVSLRAGGTGLNLTAADHVVHLDPWWNPAVEDQATDRAHRIGQQRPVTVFRMVSRATIESSILGLHATKRDLAAQILDEGGAAVTVSAEALVALIEEGASDGEATKRAEPVAAKVPRARGRRTVPRT